MNAIKIKYFIDAIYMIDKEINYIKDLHSSHDYTLIIMLLNDKKKRLDRLIYNSKNK